MPCPSGGMRTRNNRVGYACRTRIRRFTDAGSTPAASTNHQTPTVLGWGFFLPDHAELECSWGSLRITADFASRPNRSSPATFHAFLAIPRSDLAPLKWPEVRKAHDHNHCRSIRYTRTSQAVGLQHWVMKETLWLRFVGNVQVLPRHCNRWRILLDGQRQRLIVRTSSGQLQ